MTDTISKERVIENAQNIYDMFVSNYGFSSVLTLDMKTVLDSLRANLSQQAEQVPPTDKELFTIYCADVAAGDWHLPSSNYYAGFRAGWKLAAAPKGGV